MLDLACQRQATPATCSPTNNKATHPALPFAWPWQANMPRCTKAAPTALGQTREPVIDKCASLPNAHLFVHSGQILGRQRRTGSGDVGGGATTNNMKGTSFSRTLTEAADGVRSNCCDMHVTPCARHKQQDEATHTEEEPVPYPILVRLDGA
jgi:hypothetical protein